jgi:hypothetical protein
MKRGSTITVQDYFGNSLSRVLVDWDEEYVFVCDRREWDAATAAGREPINIGFSRRFIMDEKQSA